MTILTTLAQWWGAGAALAVVALGLMILLGFAVRPIYLVGSIAALVLAVWWQADRIDTQKSSYEARLQAQATAHAAAIETQRQAHAQALREAQDAESARAATNRQRARAAEGAAASGARRLSQALKDRLHDLKDQAPALADCRLGGPAVGVLNAARAAALDSGPAPD